MRLPVRGTSPIRRETPSQAPHSTIGASPAPAWRSDALTTRTPTQPSPQYNRTTASPNAHPRRADSSASTRRATQESLITQVQRNNQPLVHALPAEFLPPEPKAGTFTPLLPPKDKSFGRRNTLVLDLDETLVHSSFKPISLVDILLDIELDGNTHTVYVRKRPSVDKFMQRVSELFEVVVLTASLEVYADPVLDELDYDGYWVHHRLFRDSCANLNGNYIKDLSYLGRPLNKTIIIDNSPTSYLFQPRNALPISSWFDDPSDTELEELLPVLERAAVADDIYTVLDQYRQGLSSGGKW